MVQERLDRTIARLASRQYGVISRAQATSIGATNKQITTRLAAGRWERLRSGVYRLAGTPASWEQRLMVACLACGGFVAVSHEPAGALWEFPGCAELPPELSVPRASACRCRDVIVHRVQDLRRFDVTRVRGIPVTTPARTLLDLAGVIDHDRVEEALDDAIRRRLVSVTRMRRLVDALARNGRGGIASIRTLLAARDEGVVPHSVFETRLARLLASSGLPAPIRQYRTHRRDGRDAAADFAYPEQRVIIEADGYRWHSGRRAWESDLARRNALTEAGWRLVHVTWSDLVERPVETIGRIRSILAR